MVLPTCSGICKTRWNEIARQQILSAAHMGYGGGGVCGAQFGTSGLVVVVLLQVSRKYLVI